MKPEIDKTDSAASSAPMGQSNEDYRRMLDDSPVYFSAFLPDGTLMFVNESLANVAGKRRDDLIGLSFFDMLSPDEAEMVRKHLSRLSPQQPIHTHTQLYTTPGGDRRWQQWTNRAFFDEHGLVVRYQSVGQDITEQKQIERQLKVSEENYRSFVNLTSDAVHRCTRSGTAPYRIDWIGGSVGSISGYSIEEIFRTGCFLPYVHPDDRQTVADKLIGMVPGDVEILEFRFITKQGETRWIAEKCRCEKGRTEDELVLLGSIRDVTERKEMEETLRRTFAELKRHDSWMVMLNHMNDLLLSIESREEAYAIISNSAEKLFAPYSGGLAIFTGENSSELEVVVCWGDESGMNLTFPMSDCWALRRRAPHKIEDPAKFIGCKLYQGRGEHPHFCLPLIARGQILGLLQIIASESAPKEQFDEMYNLAITMSESVTLALSNLLLREALRDEAIHDPLTGLFNRRYLEETLSLELMNHQRNKMPLTVAMLDLDHFKSFNDEYGHEAGDIVLKEIGALLRRSLRGGDIACRYGGEELTVILSGSTMENALPRLDNIRQTIMHLSLYCRDKELPAVTVSIGMSEARPNELEVANLLRRADAALYQAKQEGRNRIVAAAGFGL